MFIWVEREWKGEETVAAWWVAWWGGNWELEDNGAYFEQFHKIYRKGRQMNNKSQIKSLETNVEFRPSAQLNQQHESGMRWKEKSGVSLISLSI